MTDTVTRPIREARAAGQQAVRDGRQLRDNPYRDDDTPKGHVLARMWAAGFASADPVPVDYTS
jgi:hypothetical protein